MLRCDGQNCPLKEECYRFTQPSPGRDAFPASPYNHAAGACEQFYSNIPNEELVRETAYHIWQRNGHPEGRQVEHWYEAYLSLCLNTGRVKSVLGVTL